jgi:hypothetical protein
MIDAIASILAVFICVARQSMGKRGFGSKRRTVLQLNDEPRKQPTFGLGYRAADSVPLPDGMCFYHYASAVFI